MLKTLIMMCDIAIGFVVSGEMARFDSPKNITNAGSNYRSGRNSGDSGENNDSEQGDLALDTYVVELASEKQMRVGRRLPSGKYECYANGVKQEEFAEIELMEFDKWVREVYKK